MFKLEGYDQHSDELVGEVDLPEVDLAAARRILATDAPDVGDSLYPVTDEVARRLKAYTEFEFDPHEFDYFLVERVD